MPEQVIAVHTIGQTPRPDLTEGVARVVNGRFALRGALDGLTPEQVPRCAPDGYPLETGLNDGSRVVVDAAFLEPRLQRLIDELDDHAAVHLVLCAGWFPNLTSRRRLIVPFDAGVTELTSHGHTTLEVVVPFAAQAAPAAAKWATAGFSCRIHPFDEKAPNARAVEWLRDRVGETRAGAVVFDYVGFSPAMRADITADFDLPVFDLGDLAVRTLELDIAPVTRPIR